MSSALAATIVKVLHNARDIQAAWKQLRRHEQALNGKLDQAKKGSEA
jgi:hypothetical protein